MTKVELKKLNIIELKEICCKMNLSFLFVNKEILINRIIYKLEFDNLLKKEVYDYKSLSRLVEMTGLRAIVNNDGTLTLNSNWGFKRSEYSFDLSKTNLIIKEYNGDYYNNFKLPLPKKIIGDFYYYYFNSLDELRNNATGKNFVMKNGNSIHPIPAIMDINDENQVELFKYMNIITPPDAIGLKHNLYLKSLLAFLDQIDSKISRYRINQLKKLYNVID
jgi:hypothetical protein